MQADLVLDEALKSDDLKGVKRVIEPGNHVIALQEMVAELQAEHFAARLPQHLPALV